MSDVVIVGGGLAGLSCACRLAEAGIGCQVLEAADQVGGRARTDEVDGFLLDRGFQVLLTAYPEAQRQLDPAALELSRFEPGALVRYGGRFRRFVDPWRRPRHLLASAVSPAATLGDKLRLARLRQRLRREPLEQIYAKPETTTRQALVREGFSTKIVERFFTPFLGGVFLENELVTSSRMFEFVFKMFAAGDAALPAAGMGELAAQLARRLPSGAVQTHANVERVESNSVELADGRRIAAETVVVACDGPAAARLLAEPQPAEGRDVTCLYYAADYPPIDEPILVLNGEGEGPINNLCVPSQVAKTYAPEGRSLISATVLGIVDDRDRLQAEVECQLANWFGAPVEQWRHLRTYRIRHALPQQAPPALSPVAKPAVRDDGILVCGDVRDTASIEGALASGRRAADEVVSQRRQ